MARKLNNHHYIATPPRDLDSPVYVHRGLPNRGYSTDGEESQRAPSEHTLSEYTVANERRALDYATNDRRAPDYAIDDRRGQDFATNERSRTEYATNERRGSGSSTERHKSHNGRDKRGGGHSTSQQQLQQRSDNEGSDIYVTSAAYRAPSELSRGSRYSRPPSHYSYRSGRPPSDVSTVKTKNSRKGGLMVETMSAPNPFCPNTKGICCLMLLLNLGIILVTLGFVIVIQFFEPVFVWILGIVFLVFGFMTLIGSLLYCVHVCRDARGPKDVRPDELFWTHHWQKTIGSPEIHYKPEDKHHDDRYSDRYSVSKYSERDRRGERY